MLHINQLANLTIDDFPSLFEKPKGEICGGTDALTVYQIHETAVIDGSVIGKSEAITDVCSTTLMNVARWKGFGGQVERPTLTFPNRQNIPVVWSEVFAGLVGDCLVNKRPIY